MKKRFPKLEWYALHLEYSTKKLEPINILREDLLKDILALLKEKPSTYTYSDVKEVVRKWAIYHYWGKFEAEFKVYTLFDDEVARTDVWHQIEPNLDRLTEYLMRELLI